MNKNKNLLIELCNDHDRIENIHAFIDVLFAQMVLEIITPTITDLRNRVELFQNKLDCMINELKNTN